MKDITLYFREGSSDKQYRVWIEQVGTLHVVRVAYGRRGGNQTVGSKTAPVYLPEAERAFERLVKEKTSKGYAPGPGAVPIVVSKPTPETATEFIRPMLLEDADLNAAGSFIGLEEFVAQMKSDGIRCQIHLDGDRIHAYSRTAKPVALTRELVESLEALDHEYSQVVLDGELVDGEFHGFDVMVADVNVEHLNYIERLKLVEKILPAHRSGAKAFFTPTARSRSEKEKMFAVLQEQGAEGIVFKRKYGRYQSGRNSEGFKVKFIATATVLVHSVNTRRSVNMALSDGSMVGSVTIPPNKKVPAEGQLIEVRYLYAHRGGCLIQPVFMRLRSDVQSADSPRSLQYKGEKRGAA